MHSSPVSVIMRCENCGSCEAAEQFVDIGENNQSKYIMEAGVHAYRTEI